MAFSSIDTDIALALKEYTSLYDQAEKALKVTEIDTLSGIAIAAANELRYAGQHIARIFALSNKGEILNEIELGQRHAKRAIYDAYDAAIMFYFKQFKQFMEEYQAIPIVPSYPGYMDDKGRMRALQNDIAEENREIREDYAERKQGQLAVAKEIASKCDDAREELNKQKISARTAAKRHLVLVIIGIVAMLIAAIGLFKN